MTAVLAGATGLVGAACFRLLESHYDRVIALVRRPHDSPRAQVVNFNHLEKLDLPTAAHVFCALGTTIKKAGSQRAFRRVDFDYPLELARLVAACQATHFILVSSVDAHPRSNNFYLRVKGELEEAVRELPIPVVHIFRPSFLVGRRAESRVGERLAISVAQSLSFLLAGPLRRYRPIPAEAVARAMVAAASQPEPGRFIHHYDDIRRLAGG